MASGYCKDSRDIWYSRRERLGEVGCRLADWESWSKTSLNLFQINFKTLVASKLRKRVYCPTASPIQHTDRTQRKMVPQIGHTSLPTVTAGHTGDDSNICRELKKTLQEENKFKSTRKCRLKRDFEVANYLEHWGQCPTGRVFQYWVGYCKKYWVAGRFRSDWWNIWLGIFRYRF